MNYYEMQRAENPAPLSSLTFQHLAELAGMNEHQANQAGYCRAELINLLTGAYQPQN